MEDHRTFAVTNASGSWGPDTVIVPAAEVAPLRSFFAGHYPQHRIVEILPSGVPLTCSLSPIALIVEVEMKDEIDMSAKKALGLLRTVITAGIARLPALADAVKNDEGYQASYYWDATLKNLAMHLVCPNTYMSANDLYVAMQGIHLPSAPLTAAYKGLFLQDKVLGFSRCVPIFMGAEYTVLEGGAITITAVRPQIAAPPLPIQMSGGLTSRCSFGSLPVWLVPVEHTVEFLVRMIRSHTSEYDNLCCDVAYTECGTLPEETIWRIVGMKPRVGMKERSVRFLYWIAKRVAPTEFSQWIFEQCAVIAHQFSNEAVTDELLQRIFLLSVEGDFVAINDGNDASAITLYYFMNTWRVDKGLQRLSAAISRLLNTFVGHDLKDYMTKTNQMDLYKVLLSEVVRLNYTTPMRSHTIRAVARMLTENIFFDEDPNLIGCNNVVIELGARAAVARSGRPEDLISMTTHIHYQHYHESECGEVKTIFRKLFGDEQLRSWFFRLLCSLLSGTNPERCFYVMFGCARNGKSELLNFLEIVLGDYFSRFSSKALNERKDPSSTSPELATLHGKRVAASSELKAGEQMEADILKALTGNDSIMVRALYKNPRLLRMMARIMIASNHFPVFLNADKALRDRTVLIPLEAVFDTYGAPATEFEQYQQGHFPAVGNFRETLQRLAPMMLSMMVDGFADYKIIGLEPKPQKVRDLCEAYWHEVGVQSRFIADCLEFVDLVVAPTPEKPLAVCHSDGDDSSEEEGGAQVPAIPAPPAPTGRPKLTYTAGYDRFVAWATSRQMDISKYPRFTFKSLMDSELAAMRHHKIEFSVDGWIGCRLRS